MKTLIFGGIYKHSSLFSLSYGSFCIPITTLYGYVIFIEEDNGKKSYLEDKVVEEWLIDNRLSTNKEIASIKKPKKINIIKMVFEIDFNIL